MKLGIIGYGSRIHGMVGIFREVSPDLQIVAILDPDREKVLGQLAPQDRETARFAADIQPFLQTPGLDAVAIGTRCNLHAPYAVEVAATDLPLFLEKPVAVSMAQALALETAFEASRCEVVVSFPLRVSPLCVHAARLIAQDAVGRVEHLRAFNHVPYGTAYFDHDGYRNFSITQGLFLQKATHDFDYLMLLAGAPIVRVAAMAGFGRVFGGPRPAGLRCSVCAEADTCPESPRNRKRNGSGGRVKDHACLFAQDLGSPETGMNEDASSALLEFEGGAHGVYSQVFFARRDAGARGAVVSGYNGTVSFDWHSGKLRHVRHHIAVSDEASIGSTASHMGGDLELARNFIDVIQGKAKSRAPIHAGLQSVYACLAARESALRGTFVDVRQVGGTAGRSP